MKTIMELDIEIKSNQLKLFEDLLKKNYKDIIDNGISWI